MYLDEITLESFKSDMTLFPERFGYSTLILQ